MTPLEFRDVRGFEGHYIVSNTGIVISVYRCWHDGRSLRAIRTRVRACCISRGYRRVLLYAPDGRRRQVAVHVLVAEAFCPPYRGETVNHKDYDRLNNNASNLEWCSRHANTVHGKLRKKNVYLTGVQIDEIRTLGHMVSRATLADRYNVSCPTIDKIVNGAKRQYRVPDA